MKKIIMAFAVIAMAVSVQAAAVNWKVSGTAATKDYTVYVMAGAVIDTWDSATAVAAAAVDSGVIALSGRNYLASGTASDAALTKTDSFYYVVISADGSQYAVSSAYAGADYVYDPNAAPPESAPAVLPSFASATATYKEFGGSSGDIPEPTSGLLMLLGVAGLALRRRQR
ncbi:MAG: PEP-CTERM sorting domain-containing protein [Kiritimatiellia bacterium]